MMVVKKPKRTFGDLPSFEDLKGDQKNIDRNKNVSENGNVSINVNEVVGVFENGNENNPQNENVLGNIDKTAFKKLVQEKKKVKRVKFEEANTRVNFWIRNDIKEILDILCDGIKGERYRIVNEALMMYLNKMMNEKKK